MGSGGTWCPLKTSNTRKVHDGAATGRDYYLLWVSQPEGCNVANVLVYRYTPAVYSNETDYYAGANATKSVFVVLDLKPELSVKNGDGSEEHPYELVKNISE